MLSYMSKKDLYAIILTKITKIQEHNISIPVVKSQDTPKHSPKKTIYESGNGCVSSMILQLKMSLVVDSMSIANHQANILYDLQERKNVLQEWNLINILQAVKSKLQL